MNNVRDSMDITNLSGLVSVITPAYNCKNYIEKTLKCVAQQTVPVLEHIVIDDGSTDDTLDHINRLQANYPNLKVISQSNQGAGPARNAGIREARGRYIAFLDGDDIWLPEKLEHQLYFMETHNLGFTYGDYKTVDTNTNTCLARYNLPAQLTYKELLNGCPIGCLTVAFNQETFGKQYMPNVRRGQDWALWLKLTRNGTVAQKYPGNLAIYHHHPNSLSKNKIKKVFDVYGVYTKQEHISPVKAIWHLAQHVWYSILKTKRYVT